MRGDDFVGLREVTRRQNAREIDNQAGGFVMHLISRVHPETKI